MQGNTDQGFSFKYDVPYMFLLLGDDFWCGLEFCGMFILSICRNYVTVANHRITKISVDLSG